MKPLLLGPDYSVYLRIVKIALIEKGVVFDQITFDVFDRNDWPEDWLDRQPFGLAPAFEHEEFRLYEARAITHYVDEGFMGPPLQPGSARDRARMEQIISVLDGQGYWPMVREIYVQRKERAAKGDCDETVVAAAVPKAERCLAALNDLLGDRSFLAGRNFSLADAHAAPMFWYFLETEEGQEMVKAQGALKAWWDSIKERPSVLLACRTAEPS